MARDIPPTRGQRDDVGCCEPVRDVRPVAGEDDVPRAAVHELVPRGAVSDEREVRGGSAPQHLGPRVEQDVLAFLPAQAANADCERTVVEAELLTRTRAIAVVGRGVLLQVHAVRDDAPLCVYPFALAARPLAFADAHDGGRPPRAESLPGDGGGSRRSGYGLEGPAARLEDRRQSRAPPAARRQAGLGRVQVEDVGPLRP